MLIGILLLTGMTCATRADEQVVFKAQSRVTDDGEEVLKTVKTSWRGKETALVICDMWAKHWCDSATRRVGEMAPRMNQLAEALRDRGVLIIHCPSSGVKYYQDTPMRKLAQLAPVLETRIPLQSWCSLDEKREKPLPIDDSDDGCDCQPRCSTDGNRMDRHQIAVIKIKRGDAVTDSAEAYYLMRQRGIKNVIIVGVHTNMCVLGRPFSIRQMVYQGQNVALVRDLTDTMYNPRSRPFVPHTQGTDLVIEHIERHWCPTFSSKNILGGKTFRFSDHKRASSSP
jgi:nicotinamidase-related amidase